MLKAGRGTIIFTGATASVRGSAKFAMLACPKFALRALGQSLAREFQPQACAPILKVCHTLICLTSTDGSGQTASQKLLQ